MRRERELRMDQLAVYVNSCDKYSWIWDAFFKSFKKYWPDCPYDLFLGSNEIDPEIDKVTTLLSGHDSRWGFTTRTNLERIKAEYVLFMQEDYLLREPVRTHIIEKVQQNLISGDGHCVRLNDSFMKKYVKSPDQIVVNPPGTPFRTSLQASIWKRSTLLKLIRDEETPWDFEVKGSRRSDQIESGFYISRGRCLPYYFGGAVNQGRLMLNFYPEIKKLGAEPASEHFMLNRQFMDQFMWYVIFDKITFQSILPKHWIRKAESMCKDKFERGKNFISAKLASYYINKGDSI